MPGCGAWKKNRGPRNGRHNFDPDRVLSVMSSFQNLKPITITNVGIIALPPKQGERTVQKRLREFEEMVLLSVLIAGEEAYGAAIQRILEEEAGRVVLLGAIYTALDRLSQKGLVRSEFGEPTPVIGGRRKRYYELTPAGRKQVVEVRRVREAMWKRIPPEALSDGVAK